MSLLPTVVALDTSWAIERNLSTFSKRIPDPDQLISAVVDVAIRQLFQYAIRHKARHLVAVMDGGSNFRYEVYPLYKHRRATYTQGDRVLSADEVKELLLAGALSTATRERSITHECRDAFKAMCRALGIPVMHLKRYEADDGLASLAAWANTRKDVKVVLCTPDKDIVQSINDYACQWRPGTGSGQYAQPELLVDTASLSQRLIKLVGKHAAEWDAEQYLQWQILRGDDGDDIPRLLPPATAAKLLNEHGTLQRVYKELVKVARAKAEPPPFSGADLSRNIQLITLKRDLVDPDMSPDDLRVPLNSSSRLPKGLHHHTGTAIGEWVGMPPAGAKLGLFSKK